MLYPDGALPLHNQLREIIRHRIESGEWRPRHRLPGERQLITQYGVSRTTVRQALGELVNEGLLYRQHGRGTFVSAPKIAQSLAALMGFAEELQSRGYAPEITLLSAQTEPCPADIRARLQSPGETAVVVRRLIRVDGQPLLIDENYLAEAVGRMVLDFDLRRTALHTALERLGFAIEAGVQTVEAAAASPEDASALGLPDGAPLLLVSRTTLAPGGRPLFFSRAKYRGDRYQYAVQLYRSVPAVRRAS